jgi:predicted RNA-binding Zn ribbon-like protein
MMPDRLAARPDPLFVGDHLAVDFLNTVVELQGEVIEWLRSGADLVQWLDRAGAIGPDVIGRFRSDRDPLRVLDSAAEQARALREWLRSFLERNERTPLERAALTDLEPLNRLLARDDAYYQVGAQANGDVEGEFRDVPAQRFRLHRKRRWTAPEQLLQPVAEAIGDLICHGHFRLIRTCEGPGCTLMFYDRTKAHARRWCSMAVCGNRAKAAAHRARRHQTAKWHG